MSKWWSWQRLERSWKLPRGQHRLVWGKRLVLSERLWYQSMLDVTEWFMRRQSLSMATEKSWLRGGKVRIVKLQRLRGG